MARNREAAAINSWLRQRVDEAFADPRLSVPAREVFDRLREHHTQQAKAERNEA